MLEHNIIIKLKHQCVEDLFKKHYYSCVTPWIDEEGEPELHVRGGLISCPFPSHSFFHFQWKIDWHQPKQPKKKKTHFNLLWGMIENIMSDAWLGLLPLLSKKSWTYFDGIIICFFECLFWIWWCVIGVQEPKISWKAFVLLWCELRSTQDE